MTRATIAVSDELAAALAAYGRDHGLASELDGVVEAALRELLEGRGYLAPFRPFYVTPLERDEGETDVSINHDRYFVDGSTSGPG